jgi:site-specific recombinase XerD
MDKKSALPLTRHSEIAESEDDLRVEAAKYFDASRAKNTKKAYASDWSDFCAWCRRQKRAPLPATPQTVALYLTHRARFLKVSTIGRRMASISVAHREAELKSPTNDPAVKKIWAGVRREKGMRQSRKSPALIQQIREMVKVLDDSKIGNRDRAIILLGFAGGMRRSEIVGLDVSDLELTEKGIIVTIQRSKTDQVGRGRKIGIPYGDHEQTCPVRAIQAWLLASDISEGALFRAINRHGHIGVTRLGDRAVALIVQRSLRAAGISAKSFAGHSLRSGFATSAAMEGASERDIQNQTGHKSLLVLRRYIREGELFRNNAAAKLGL